MGRTSDQGAVCSGCGGWKRTGSERCGRCGHDPQRTEVEKLVAASLCPELYAGAMGMELEAAEKMVAERARSIQEGRAVTLSAEEKRRIGALLSGLEHARGWLVVLVVGLVLLGGAALLTWIIVRLK